VLQEYNRMMTDGNNRAGNDDMADRPSLFSPLTLRDVTFRNRIFVSPMCQYSSHDGLPNDWHLVHLGSRAVGGAGLVMVEANSVSPEGRISPFDSGIWSDEHAVRFRPIADFIKGQGAAAGIQLAHAGRKASTDAPWRGGHPIAPADGGWQPVAPSAIAFDAGYPTPAALSIDALDAIVQEFILATERSRQAGFDVVEIHMAHGYLLHQFLSPLSNRREDEFGGTRENRMRFPLLVAEAVRDTWPAERPLFVRISATDWAEGGWDPEQSLRFSELLRAIGIDLIDCSSGGLVPHVRIPLGPGYQVPFASSIRAEVGIATAAVGLITEPAQANDIIASGRADAVLLARQMLRDPYFPLHAAQALGVNVPWPAQYLRARQ
jgi:2,4-dienoyl-CoA reductase-like NADH-dependent reductase (Old Yellow Enzyme family)